MITSDGRSAIEAEMEHTHFTVADFGEQRIQIDYREHSPTEGLTYEVKSAADLLVSRIAHWFSQLFSPQHI